MSDVVAMMSDSGAPQSSRQPQIHMSGESGKDVETEEESSVTLGAQSSAMLSLESSAERENGTEQSQSSPSNSLSSGSSESDREEKETLQRLLQESREESERLKEKCGTLEGKLELALRQKEFATKEKETMVMKYAMSEKNLMQQKVQAEQLEKKSKEVLNENKILQHKVQTMISEKTRICQMLDNKTYEHKGAHQELERIKADLGALETKLKWSQNGLKTEIELHKETQEKLQNVTAKLQEATDQMEQAKAHAQDSIKTFQSSEDNRAHVLDQQLKEQQATLILLRHERDEKDQQVKSLASQLEKLQGKHQEMVHENNALSVKVQQLERDRLESEQRLSELRACADQQRQDSVDLQAKNSQVDQLRLQLQNERDQLQACNDQMELLKLRNAELEWDISACRVREAELLLFTQQLTDKNVRLQSEFTALETRVQQLTCEQTLLKRSIKEQETRCAMLSAQLAQERLSSNQEIERLTKNLGEKSAENAKLTVQVSDLQGDAVVGKRKFELALREVGKELQHCRKRLEHYESYGNTGGGSSSSSSSSLSAGGENHLNGGGGGSPPIAADQVKVIQPDGTLDRQTLIEHIVKLQRISARKSEKLDFLEEHVNSLVGELQKKSRLLQSYILREQSGALTSNKMDNNKAQLAKLNGVMASMYNCRVSDDNLTLELALDINRKLQAVLEDALLKNITLKENMDTLGQEIERLSSTKQILNPKSS